MTPHLMIKDFTLFIKKNNDAIISHIFADVSRNMLTSAKIG